MKQENQVSNAWLLEYVPNQFVAISTQSMQEFIVSPNIIEVPLTPHYCKSVFRWRNRLLPVLNLGKLLINSQQNKSKVVVIKYWNGNQVDFAAIQLHKQPVLIQIYDADYCDLSEDADTLSKITRACFRYNGLRIPIINLEKLFLTPNLVSGIQIPMLITEY
ncbi:chemotaxis protein CheW [Aliikangiella sp. IMCC44359]|uniref:chemotaxis protein CheW n=1 Tax=Aliikangiella sp. IMCC44359 TaxID=3459125 RepID=UPI00403AEF8E